MIEIALKKELIGAYGSMTIDIELQIEPGHVVTLYGDSGAGKTSTLRMIAGLMKPDTGRITVDGELWYDASSNRNIPPQSRNIGFVFQDYGLFPNMSVRQNLEFGLRKQQDKTDVEELIDMMALTELQSHKPQTLSGGQKQRVALARALVQRPNLLLLDEPLSALDFNTRRRLQDYLLKVQQKFGLTTVLVSHDISEIHKLSNWVYVMDHGKLTRQGAPTEVFEGERLSGKFKFLGEITNIDAQGVIYIVSVLIQNQIVKVIVQRDDLSDLHVGDKVVVASKAFNPVIHKIDI